MNFGMDWETEHRRVLLDGNAVLERSAQSVARSQAVAAESEQIGTEVISELGEQRDRLLRTKRRLSQTDEELNKTRKILNVMRLKVLTNKIVLILIILLELVILEHIVLFIAYFIFSIHSIFSLTCRHMKRNPLKMVILHDDEYYQNRIPEPDLGALRNFLRFIWNPDRKQLLGRSGKEWALLGFFYLCFFTVLGSLFALQMWISIEYASKLERPFFLYSGLAPKSYFGVNFPLFRQLDFASPGIAFKPNIVLPTKSPIIWIDNSSANARPKRYVQALSDFLQEYNKSKENYKMIAECNDGASIAFSNIKPCYFDIESLGVCGQSPYGYTDPLQPCVLIKFNKRFNWVPIPYNKSSLLPENMPYTLQKAVQLSNKFQIWLWCDGVNNVDKEHIGEIEYLPSPGFPVQYFPFMGQPDYLAPVVALRFKNITCKPILFRLVTVECSLWAHNIKNAQNALDFQIILGES